jgi:hypothetical protein
MNTDRRAEFNPAERPNKKPRSGWQRGFKVKIADDYFLAKIYFASFDLWFEAALRWMTLLLTARSRAEL